MTRPRIAVFGAGLVGARHVAEAAKQATLCAIVDPALQAKELADQHGVPWFADPQACLDRVQVDGVVVATPNHLHADHTLIALEHGAAVLIEKPIADTLENADRIVAASEKCGVPVLVGHHRRHNPIIAKAKALIDAGTLGDIVAVTGQFWLYKPPEYFKAQWRQATGGGPILINCIHDIDLMRHLVGEVAEVQAMRSTRQRQAKVEDTAAITIRFDTGALGSFSISDTIVAPWSWELTSGENPIYPEMPASCYRIGGTQAALSIPDMRLWQHEGPRSWWSDMTDSRIDTPKADAFARQFQHFCQVIDGAPPLVCASEGRNSLAAVLKCMEDDAFA